MTSGAPDPVVLPPATPTGAVAVIGLGAMGLPIARALIAGGRSVVGVDIDPDRRAAFDSMGPTASSLVELEPLPPLLLTSLPSGPALAAVVDQLLTRVTDLPPDLTLVETSTLGLADKELAFDRLTPYGVAVLDCPLSGTAVQAEAGDLAVYASGDPAALDRCEPALRTFARSVHRLGTFGAGTSTKLIANLLVAVHIAAAAEALVLAERTGLTEPAVLAALTDGAGTSRMLEVRGPMMLAPEDAGPPSMTVSLFRKDLGLIRALGEQYDCPLPLFSQTAQLFAATAARGNGRRDTSSVVETLRSMAGLERS